MLTRRAFTILMALSALPAYAKTDAMRIIVPYPAGGPLDASARFIAEKLTTANHRVIVENRPGAAGSRGMQAAKNAKPDGKTLVIGALATLAVNPYMQKDLPYQASDFSPVALLSDAPNVLVMSAKRMASLGVSDASSLLQYIKNHPGKLNFASGGVGSAGHLAGEILRRGGFPIEHIPYAGAAAAQLSIFSGETDLLFDNWGNTREAVQSGKLKALAVTTATPYPALAVPTLQSLGIDCDLSTWFGLLAPKGTAALTTQNLYQLIADIFKDQTQQQVFERLAGGYDLRGPEAFSHWIDQEQVKYATLLKRLNLLTA